MMYAEHVVLYNSDYKEWPGTVCVEKKESPWQSHEGKKNVAQPYKVSSFILKERKKTLGNTIDFLQ